MTLLEILKYQLNCIAVIFLSFDWKRPSLKVTNNIELMEKNMLKPLRCAPCFFNTNDVVSIQVKNTNQKRSAFIRLTNKASVTFYRTVTLAGARTLLEVERLESSFSARSTFAGWDA